MGAMATEPMELPLAATATRAPSDEDLIHAFLGGDLGGIDLLVTRYERPLFAFIVRITGRPDIAADLFQETFVRVVRHAGSFGGRSRFKTWLYTIASNLCRSRAPREARETGLSLVDAAGRPDGGSGPERRVLDDEVGRRVARAVEGLPVEQREVFVLKVYDELSFPEIAEVVGRPVGTTKSQMRAAVLRLRDELSDMARGRGAR